LFQIYKTRVDIREGAPLQAEAQGLVVAANDHLWMGGGAALAVKQAGGEGIEIEAVRQGPVALGTAVSTGAGSLGFRRIYHAVVMGQDLKVRHDQIPGALNAALGLAARENVESLVVTPLESDELIGPFHEAAGLVVSTLFDALTGKTTVRELVLSVGRAEARDAYRAAFHQVLGSGGHK